MHNMELTRYKQGESKVQARGNGFLSILIINECKRKSKKGLYIAAMLPQYIVFKKRKHDYKPQYIVIIKKLTLFDISTICTINRPGFWLFCLYRHFN